MASIELRNQTYSIIFRFGGRKFSRSLKTGDKKQALARLVRLEENLRLVEAGRLEIPTGADVPTFLLSDGKIDRPFTLKSFSLIELCEQFSDAIPKGSLEDSTQQTLFVHMRHLRRIFGDAFQVQKLAMSELQDYVKVRSAEPGLRGQNVDASTISKELGTFRSMWNWALDALLLKGEFPRKGVRLPKVKEHPPFQTWDEIEPQLVGLDSNEQRLLWDCLYLRLEEIEELLVHVKKTARHPFIYPMVVTAAHTGARRSELMRSQVADIQKDLLVIRERKRKQRQESTRRVPLSSKLEEALADWLKIHPGGKFAFCQGSTRKGVQSPEQVSRNAAQCHLKRTLAGSRWEVIRGWHCFRHSFISNLASRGVDQRLIDEFVGHTSEEVKRRYRHLLPDVKQQAIRSVLG